MGTFSPKLKSLLAGLKQTNLQIGQAINTAREESEETLSKAKKIAPKKAVKKAIAKGNTAAKKTSKK